MQMNEPVKVTIDLEKIARNLRTPDGLSAGVESAHSFLRYAGFRSDGDGTWIGTRQQLRRFNPGEIVSVETMGAFAET